MTTESREKRFFTVFFRLFVAGDRPPMHFVQGGRGVTPPFFPQNLNNRERFVILSG